MEDAVAMHTFEDLTSFFAVYDGHNGSECSEFLSHCMHEYIHENEIIIKDLSIDNLPLYRQTLKEIFRVIDVEFLELSGYDGGPDSAGSTCVFIFIRYDRLIIANVGDSRAVMCVNGTAIDLTKDQKPSDPLEKERIIKSGGAVIGGRVQGVLGVSRAFGDYPMKNVNNIDVDRDMVTCLPVVDVRVIDPEMEFIVLACDGLWDVFGSQEVVTFIKNLLDNGMSEEQAAEELCHSAYDNRSNDNITVIIVKITEEYRRQLLKIDRLKQKKIVAPDTSPTVKKTVRFTVNS
eukprot:TRINITY_DN727_c0_g1_i2.p1 TRINITY_DN727_c0_g1~~TRINITY_DN727_c0_g1_i2.p1  ORF type:complete len:290 (+),score=63.88 TRINITY_DN727_c0_g1_i2:436-1305(+)